MENKKTLWPQICSGMRNISPFLRNNWKQIVLASIGLIVMGVGVAINNLSLLGNDPVSVFYDGISHTFDIPLGNASIIINTVMFFIALFFARKYVSIATVLYFLFLSPCIKLGMDFFCGTVFQMPSGVTPSVVVSTMKGIFATNHLLPIILSLVGCIFMFTGLALFVALNVGVDPWNALALQISDKINKPYKYVKIICDVICFGIGAVLTGVWGPTTLITALLGGPYIKVVSVFLCKTLLKWCKIENTSLQESTQETCSA